MPLQSAAELHRCTVYGCGRAAVPQPPVVGGGLSEHVDWQDDVSDCVEQSTKPIAPS